jgi:hypothetical protein
MIQFAWFSFMFAFVGLCVWEWTHCRVHWLDLVCIVILCVISVYIL